MANDTPSTQRYYAVHRLIEATTNYPTFYILHMADMLLKHGSEDEYSTKDNDQPHTSLLPKLKLGFGQVQNHAKWKEG